MLWSLISAIFADFVEKLSFFLKTNVMIHNRRKRTDRLEPLDVVLTSLHVDDPTFVIEDGQKKVKIRIYLTSPDRPRRG
jgi:hypothetical protein